MAQTNRGATVTSVSGSASSVALFAANPSASARSVYNDSSSVLYLKYGTTASATSFTVQLRAGDLFEFPSPVYDGAVEGIWATATGAARLTEVA